MLINYTITERGTDSIITFTSKHLEVLDEITQFLLEPRFITAHSTRDLGKNSIAFSTASKQTILSNLRTEFSGHTFEPANTSPQEGALTTRSNTASPTESPYRPLTEETVHRQVDRDLKKAGPTTAPAPEMPLRSKSTHSSSKSSSSRSRSRSSKKHHRSRSTRSTSLTASTVSDRSSASADASQGSAPKSGMEAAETLHTYKPKRKHKSRRKTRHPDTVSDSSASSVSNRSSASADASATSGPHGGSASALRGSRSARKGRRVVEPSTDSYIKAVETLRVLMSNSGLDAKNINYWLPTPDDKEERFNAMVKMSNDRGNVDVNNPALTKSGGFWKGVTFQKATPERKYYKRIRNVTFKQQLLNAVRSMAIAIESTPDDAKSTEAFMKVLDMAMKGDRYPVGTGPHHEMYSSLTALMSQVHRDVYSEGKKFTSAIDSFVLEGLNPKYQEKLRGHEENSKAAYQEMKEKIDTILGSNPSASAQVGPKGK